jgi:hypothetical protein
MSLDATRQAANLAFLAGGAEFRFGDASDLPWCEAELAAMQPTHFAVRQVIDGGLTARVLQLQGADGRRYALKQARAECKVRNPDGVTSFLNELQRHAELRGAGPGIVQPLFGSLRQGFVISPWIAGRSPDLSDERAAAALFEASFALLRRGCFEWDFSPGNLLDDGERVWLYDFGYCYRFDPLRQFNSAGSTGTEHPEHHLVERIESRNLFGALLDHPEPLAAFLRFRRVALRACTGWLRELRERGAAPAITQDWARRLDAWANALDQAPEGLYLQAAQSAHENDLLDDLKGQSCTPRTLRRVDWLLAHSTDPGMQQRLRAQRQQAEAWQHD